MPKAVMRWNWGELECQSFFDIANYSKDNGKLGAMGQLLGLNLLAEKIY